jgi:hypothetical protein
VTLQSVLFRYLFSNSIKSRLCQVRTLSIRVKGYIDSFLGLRRMGPHLHFIIDSSQLRRPKSVTSTGVSFEQSERFHRSRGWYIVVLFFRNIVILALIALIATIVGEFYDTKLHHHRKSCFEMLHCMVFACFGLLMMQIAVHWRSQKLRRPQNGFRSVSKLYLICKGWQHSLCIITTLRPLFPMVQC